MLTLSLLAEAFLFIYIGISTVTIFLGKSKGSFQLISIDLILVELVILGVCRMTAIFISSIIFKVLFPKYWKLEISDVIIIWFAGLIRGSIAFALITKGTSVSHLILPAVQGIVVFTTVILGSLMPLFIIFINFLKSKGPYIPTRKSTVKPEYVSVMDYKQNRKIKGFIHRVFRKFDDQFIKPLLIYKFKEREEAIVWSKIKAQKDKQGSRIFSASNHNNQDVVDGMGDMGLKD